jgi:hypothetical protein
MTVATVDQRALREQCKRQKTHHHTQKQTLWAKLWRAARVTLTWYKLLKISEPSGESPSSAVASPSGPWPLSASKKAEGAGTQPGQRTGATRDRQRPRQSFVAVSQVWRNKPRENRERVKILMERTACERVHGIWQQKASEECSSLHGRNSPTLPSTHAGNTKTEVGNTTWGKSRGEHQTLCWNSSMATPKGHRQSRSRRLIKTIF